MADKDAQHPGKLLEDQSSGFVFRDDIIQFSHQLVTTSRNKYRKKNFNLTSQGFRNKGHNSQEFQPTTTQMTSRNSQQIIQKSGEGRSQEGDELGSHLFREGKISGFKIMNERRKGAFTTRGHKRYEIGSRQDKGYQARSVQLEKTNKIKSSNLQQSVLSFQAYRKQEANSQILQNSNTEEKGQSPIQFRKSSYGQLQKKYNKTNIKESTIEGWLNEALIEGSPQLYIDKKVQNAAINQYKIDRSSLISKGIHPDDIARLYRSLFVYSIGFNHLLKEICRSGQQLRKSIWKVYAVLLEYCSGGDFQTMIGQIERDKASRLSELKKQIQKRQKMIEESDDVHEQKHAKILRELREAQEKQKNLIQEREIILQDFHEAEQSFNQQIALRLKYQNRINEIHGVFEELRQKHLILRENNDSNLATIAKQEDIISELRNQKVELGIQLNNKIAELKIMGNEKGVIEQLMHEHEHNLRVLNSSAMDTKSQSDNIQAIVNQKNRKIDQLKIGIQSSQASQRSLLLAYNSKIQDFKKAMEENSDLHKKNLEKDNTINELIQKMREQGHAHAEVHAKLVVQFKKNEEKDNKISNLTKTLNNMEEEVRLAKLVAQEQTQKSNILEADLQKCHQNIKQMKSKQIQIANLLEEAENHIALQDRLINQKNEKEQKNERQIHSLRAKISELMTQSKQKDSKILLLDEKLTSQTQILKTKLEKLKQENDRVWKKCTRYENERDELMNQIQTNRERYAKMFQDFKNQKFERQNLNLRYQQSLTVLEEQNTHTKDLNIQISLLKDERSELIRKKRNQQFIFSQKQTALMKDLTFWKENFEKISLQAKQKKQYIHPMLYEDLHSRWIRLGEKNKILLQDKKQLQKKIKTVQQQSAKIHEAIKIQYEGSNETENKRQKEQLAKKQSQMRFLKEKTEYQSKKVKQLEAGIEKIQKQKYEAEDQLMSRESDYLQKINEKNVEIKSLNKQYQELHSQYEAKSEENQQIIQKLESAQKEIKKISDSQPKVLDSFGSSSHGDKKDPSQDKSYTYRKRVVESYKNSAKDEEGEDIDIMRPKKEPTREKVELEQSQGEKTIQQQEESEQQKKRENIREKLKGAYLYYHK